MQVLVVLYIFGFGVLSLPRVMAQQTGRHGWISVLAATLAAVASVYIISVLAQKSGKRRFPEFANAILGKPLGKLLCAAFAIRLLVTAALRLRVFGESVNEYMLPTTPVWLVLAIMLLVCVYAAVKKFETQARLAEILIFFMVIPIFYVFIVSLRGANFTNLLPLWDINAESIVRGGYNAFFSFQGIELLLIIVPFVAMNNGVTPRRAVGAVLLVGVLMTLVVVATTSVFGVHSVASQVWPIFQMMDAVEVPGQFFARQGALVMTFWIVSAFAAISAEIFFSSLLLKDVLNLGKRRYYVLCSAVLVFAAALLPNSLTSVFGHSHRLNLYTGAAFMFFIPFFMLIIYKIRRRKIDDDSLT